MKTRKSQLLLLFAATAVLVFLAGCKPEAGVAEKSLETVEVVTVKPVSHVRRQALTGNIQAHSPSGGTKLSGGEQQMLAIARILRSGAKLLLLDEPTEGLAPVIVQEIGTLIKTLRDRSYTILLVEQNYRFARAFADRHYIMENGCVADEIMSADMAAQEKDIRAYLGL